MANLLQGYVFCCEFCSHCGTVGLKPGTGQVEQIVLQEGLKESGFLMSFRL
jgi:hypothetical protein